MEDIKNLDETTVGALQHKISEIKTRKIPGLDNTLKSASLAIDKLVQSLFNALQGAFNNKTNTEQFLLLQKALNDLNAAAIGGYNFNDEQKQRIGDGKALLARLEWKLRQLVLGLSNKVIAEIKSFNKPLPDIINVMQACFFLLGNSKKEISNGK